jgi:hypothetical protein
MDVEFRIEYSRIRRLLHSIDCSMKRIANSDGVSRLIHLNRNERTLQDIRAQLDDAYRDLLVRFL